MSKGKGSMLAQDKSTLEQGRLRTMRMGLCYLALIMEDPDY